MTIIEPNKNKYYSSEFLYLGLALLFLAVSGIYIYNLNVSLKYQVGLREKAIQQLETANADLRNKIYQNLNVDSLTGIVGKQNLVSDKNPDYMESHSLANR